MGKWKLMKNLQAIIFYKLLLQFYLNVYKWFKACLNFLPLYGIIYKTNEKLGNMLALYNIRSPSKFFHWQHIWFRIACPITINMICWTHILYPQGLNHTQTGPASFQCPGLIQTAKFCSILRKMNNYYHDTSTVKAYFISQ